MQRLKVNVAVYDEDGTPHWLRPGQTPPDWAMSQLTNPDLWDDGTDDEVAAPQPPAQAQYEPSITRTEQPEVLQDTANPWPIAPPPLPPPAPLPSKPDLYAMQYDQLVALADQQGIELRGDEQVSDIVEQLTAQG